MYISFWPIVWRLTVTHEYDSEHFAWGLQTHLLPGVPKKTSLTFSQNMQETNDRTIFVYEVAGWTWINKSG